MPLALPSVVLLYTILSLAEAAAHPYDVVECEPELVSGYYVDHGGVSFMLIYLAEGTAVGGQLSRASCTLLYMLRHAERCSST